MLHLSLVTYVGKHVEDLIPCFWLQVSIVLEPLTTDAASQIDVLLHDGDSRGVDGTKIGIFEETSEITLSCLLKSEKSLRLESQLTVDAVANAPNETLEWSLSQKKIRDLLVPLDLSQCNCARSPAHLLLHATLSRGGLLDSLLGLDSASALANLGGLGTLLGHHACLSRGLGGRADLLAGDLLSGHLESC